MQQFQANTVINQPVEIVFAVLLRLFGHKKVQQQLDQDLLVLKQQLEGKN